MASIVKPCPFCGAKAFVETIYRPPCRLETTIRAACDCFEEAWMWTSEPWVDKAASESQALAVWNRRESCGEIADEEG